MLYYLSNFGDAFSLPVLNRFQDITFRTGGAFFTSVLILFLLGPRIIQLLRDRQKKGQPIRPDGPATHLKKIGTPTMGGMMILSGIVMTTLLWANLLSVLVWTVLAVTVLFGMIGFYDDYLKVIKSTEKGFSRRIRLILEFIIGGIAVYVLMRTHPSHYLTESVDLSRTVTFPFFKYLIFIPWGCFVIVASGNAVNLTDGLDGLAIVPVMIAAFSLGALAYLSDYQVFSDYLNIHFSVGTGELSIICAAAIGTGLGFLWFNAPPATIFMGDTGSLALGGMLGTLAVSMRHEIIFFIVGGLFVIETISVIIQVASFKLTGKRLFRMAPIHHHFEQLGWKESQVVIRFWIVSVLFFFLGLSILRLR
ncbi:phospho-N-acetylmuramoyl-pentapeptide-transferase [Candidatus Endowatersipora endosymbiont of Watersipora subatra]|uniref:phospho-N-acetylmuramoyl-pentapeptide- transferase n=1 Tax=Candidatus Endowatersipora endosymbiont of Watersipora subatra TaxID=3077946 RepID=UPI00312C7BAE